MAGSFWFGLFWLSSVLLFSLDLAPASAQPPVTGPLWRTLNGSQPKVVAKGGYSGLFPDSSSLAYMFVNLTSLPGTLVWCDVRLTKDSVGVCLPDIDMGNCTSISSVYPNGSNILDVNGDNVNGYFPVDFNFSDLENVTLNQGIYTRAPQFDPIFHITRLDSLPLLPISNGVWLNIQHDKFYRGHNLSMTSYIFSVLNQTNTSVQYISSPEVIFLKEMGRKIDPKKTKLIFRFLRKDMYDVSTNTTYQTLLNNLTYVKTFAAGILIPKDYIWSVSADNYLQPYTSVVLDAHNNGLEVFGSDFANDATLAYNYSYNSITEYLNFVKNENFSVDGVVSDFPITASETIGCFAHLSTNESTVKHPLIISHNGASGIYPGCTDLAYEQAVMDEADYIDCSVQITSDGVLICLDTVNLVDSTTVTVSPFGTRSSNIPEISSGNAIYTFNLSWSEIQENLKPMIENPEYALFKIVRNPRSKNSGHFMRLADFLLFARDKPISGILVTIENAPVLAKMGFNMTDLVMKELEDSGYGSHPSQQVMIQSSNSRVLMAFKQRTKYKLLYTIPVAVTNATLPAIRAIRGFADAVALKKNSIFTLTNAFITNKTTLVDDFRRANLSVFVYVLMNEFVSEPWDFVDPVQEIHSYVAGASVDGVIVDFPSAAAAYRRRVCKDYDLFLPRTGYLSDLLTSFRLPLKTTESPTIPPLNETTVLDPSLPLPEPPTAGASEGPANNTRPPTTDSASFPAQVVPSLSASVALLLLLGSLLHG